MRSAPAAVDRLDFGAEPREIGRQNRSSDADGGCHRGIKCRIRPAAARRVASRGRSVNSKTSAGTQIRRDW